MATAVIVVAAGSGTRLKAHAPKAFVAVGTRSMLELALEPISRLTELTQVVAVVPADRVEEAERMLASAGLAGRGTAVAGGAERQDSVRAGLAALEPDVGIVLVHDAARPFTPCEMFERVIDRVRSLSGSEGGVVPALPVVDTLRRVRGDVVEETVDRDRVRAVQTPQGFPRDLL